MASAEIDLNIRVNGNMTRVGFEDIDGDFTVNDLIDVFEKESGLSGKGLIRLVDVAKELVLIEVFWSEMKSEEELQSCRSEEGITVGLVDAMISIIRVLAVRDMSTKNVQEALADLFEDSDFEIIQNARQSA